MAIASTFQYNVYQFPPQAAEQPFTWAHPAIATHMKAASGPNISETWSSHESLMTL